MKRFVAEKETQANAATNEPAPSFAPFFAAAKRGDWLDVSSRFEDYFHHAPQFENFGEPDDERLRGPRWEAVKEVWGAFDAFYKGDEKYSAKFGRDVLAAIPPGSIYFGGTDPGRFIVTALCQSQVAGDPFFVLTQNSLVDSTYLDYLRQIYGKKLYIPDARDAQRSYQDYVQEARQRWQNNQLKPGENVDTNGHVQVAGQVALMELNDLMTKTIVEKNPGRGFFIEEFFPVDWMQQYLEPHGPIFKINSEPLVTLSETMVKNDRDYWAEATKPMIGDWLRDTTSVEEIAAYARKIYLQHNLEGFHGDPNFIANNYAEQMFSASRSAIARLYCWREENARDNIEKQRMAREADFACRQAWTLCPYSPIAVSLYMNELLKHQRFDDALTLAETEAAMPKSLSFDMTGQWAELVKQVKIYQNQWLQRQ